MGKHSRRLDRVKGLFVAWQKDPEKSLRYINKIREITLPYVTENKRHLSQESKLESKLSKYLSELAHHNKQNKKLKSALKLKQHAPAQDYTRQPLPGGGGVRPAPGEDKCCLCIDIPDKSLYAHYFEKHCIKHPNRVLFSDGTALLHSSTQSMTEGGTADWFSEAKEKYLNDATCGLCGGNFDKEDMSKHYLKAHNVSKRARTGDFLTNCFMVSRRAVRTARTSVARRTVLFRRDTSSRDQLSTLHFSSNSRSDGRENAQAEEAQISEEKEKRLTEELLREMQLSDDSSDGGDIYDAMPQSPCHPKFKQYKKLQRLCDPC